MAVTVGIIGLGIMGGAMARNMVEGGMTVVGYDIEPAATEAARKAGIVICNDIAALCQQASDILVSLPSVKAVQATAKAIAASGTNARTVLETSTLSLDDKMAFAKILTDAGHIALTARCRAMAVRRRQRISSFMPAATIPRLNGLMRYSWGLAVRCRIWAPLATAPR
jgi:3-hydroxyisobutyrate dehydrogenase-like beta-hydroxyacid dehydrogenase